MFSSTGSRFSVLLYALTLGSSQAFVPRHFAKHHNGAQRPATIRNPHIQTSTTTPPSPCRNTGTTTTATSSRLCMALDPVTYLRTEWISAALCTNQTPRSADVCLQLGTQDGRAVTFIPRTIRELITSSAEKDGKLTIQARRQLKQSQDRRQAATVTYVDQAADNLSETANESVDVVISLQATERMMENKLDWKRSVREAARVLKPGGRLLWVEPTDLKGESYIEYLENLVDDSKSSGSDEEESYPIFDDVGYDDIDLILQPHSAGVAIKSMDAGMSAKERAQKIKQAEDEKLAEISIQAYERGIKKKRRKRKKKKKAAADSDED